RLRPEFCLLSTPRPPMASFGPKMTDKLADYDFADSTEPAFASETAPMSAVAFDEIEPVSGAPAAEAIRVHGKFFFNGDAKHFVKGVTYGPFAVGSHGAQFPERAVVAEDFALMRQAGVNTVR